MKRSLVVALVLGLVAVTAWAQENVTVPLPTVGVRGGIDIARDRFSSAPAGLSNKSQTLGGGGITSEWNIYQPYNLSVRTDLMFMRTGGKYSLGQVTTKERVDELRLAPFLVYRFPMQYISPFVQGGPFYGWDTSHRFTRTGTINGQNASSVGDIPNWNKSNFGLNAGLGFNVPTPGGMVSVDGRYSWGLTNRNNGSGNTKEHTDGVLIMAGYDFHLPI
jgi:hypothetical protein